MKLQPSRMLFRDPSSIPLTTMKSISASSSCNADKGGTSQVRKVAIEIAPPPFPGVWRG